MDRTRYPLWAGLLCLLGVLSPALAQVTLVSSASFAEEVAPGSLATVFVAGATDEEVQATPGPAGRLPTELGGVTVDVDGRRAGIWYASPTQINLVVPLESFKLAIVPTNSHFWLLFPGDKSVRFLWQLGCTVRKLQKQGVPKLLSDRKKSS